MEPAQYCIESKGNLVRYIQDIWTSTTYPSMTGAHDSKLLGIKKEFWDEEKIRRTLFATAVMPLVRETFKKQNGEYESDETSLLYELEKDLYHVPVTVKFGNFPRLEASKKKHLYIGNRTLPTYKVNPLEIATDLIDYIGDLENLALKGVSAPISPDLFDIFHQFNKAMETKYKDYAPFLEDAHKRKVLDYLKDSFKDIPHTIIA